MHYRGGRLRERSRPSVFIQNAGACDAPLLDPSGIVREASLSACGESNVTANGSGDSQHCRLTGEVMKTRAEKRAKSAIAMIFVLGARANRGQLRAGVFAGDGWKTRAGTFCQPNFVLNLDVQVHGPEGRP